MKEKIFSLVVVVLAALGFVRQAQMLDEHIGLFVQKATESDVSIQNGGGGGCCFRGCGEDIPSKQSKV